MRDGYSGQDDVGRARDDRARAAESAAHDARTKIAGYRLGVFSTLFHGQHARIIFAALVGVILALVTERLIVYVKGGRSHPFPRHGSYTPPPRSNRIR